MKPEDVLDAAARIKGDSTSMDAFLAKPADTEAMRAVVEQVAMDAYRMGYKDGQAQAAKPKLDYEQDTILRRTHACQHCRTCNGMGCILKVNGGWPLVKVKKCPDCGGIPRYKDTYPG